MLFRLSNKKRLCFHCKGRRGLSLIEVVVSVALLSTLLVSLLSIRSRHVRQIRLASQKVLAAKLLDRQMAKWFDSETSLPVGEAGNFEGNELLSWRTFSLPDGNAWNALKVRVEAVESETGTVVSSIEVIVTPPDGRG